MNVALESDNRIEDNRGRIQLRGLPGNGRDLHNTHSEEDRRGERDVAPELRVGLTPVLAFVAAVPEPK